MLDDHPAHRGIVLQGLVDIYLRLFVAFLHEENPGVGIQESTVGGLCLDGAVAHLLRLLESFAPLTQVVGVVVQYLDVIVLPLQTAVVGRESLIVKTLIMQDLSHDGVEVRNEIGIAFLIDLRHPSAEGIESLVTLILLEMCQTEEIVERHLVGIVFRGRLTQVDHRVIVLTHPFRLHQLESDTHIVGCHLECLGKYCIDTFLRHLLQLHVSHIELIHIRILLRFSKDTVEEGEHLGTIATSLLVVGHHLSHQRHLVVDRGVLTDQHLLLNLLCQGVGTGTTVVVEHRHLCSYMIRFFLQHQPVLLQRVLFLSILQQPVTHHHMVVHVVRMTVGEVFQRLVFLVGLTEYGIDPHLRERQSFITPFQCLHQLEGRKHLLVIFLLVIQL